MTPGLDATRGRAPEALKRFCAVMRWPCALGRSLWRLLAAELNARTPLVVALEAVRERRALELSAWVGEHYDLPSTLDVQAIGMLLGVAINYLAVRARTIRVMSGVEIGTDNDWERIFAAIDALIEAALSPR